MITAEQAKTLFTPEEIAYGIQEAERWGVITTREEYAEAVMPTDAVRVATQEATTPIESAVSSRVTGEIVNVMPRSIAPGEPITVTVDYNAFHPGIVATWVTRLKATVDGASAVNVDYHAGGTGSKIGTPLYLKMTMPNRPVYIHITLEYVPITPLQVLIPGTIALASGIKLDTWTVKMLLPEQMSGVTPSVPQDAKTVIKLEETPTLDVFGAGIGEALGIPAGDVTIPGTETKVSRTYFYVGIAIAAFALIYIFFIKKGK